MNSEIPDLRLHVLRDEPPRVGAEFVLYWMTATRRLSWNYALDRAVEWALELDLPLVIFEPLRAGYRWASDRHHQSIIDGMADNARRLATSSITYYPYVEPHPGDGQGLLSSLSRRAGCVITDQSPVFFQSRLLEAGKRAVSCRLEAVDSVGLLPLAAPGRTFSAAYHFRRYLQKELPNHLVSKPNSDPPSSKRLKSLEGLPEALVDRWPMARFEENALGRSLLVGLDDIPIDRSVSAVASIGGETEARERLRAFLHGGLSQYADDRNHPDLSGTSALSSALHYGHISVHEVFQSLTEAEGWTPLRIAPPNDGRRRGWWSMSTSTEAFIDQLVTWRELGQGYCHYEEDYQSYESLPAWALETLEYHSTDRRPWLYSYEDFEAAATHDEIWNAAQRQLVEEGTLHNYLRMLWGKKILEWSAHPREALDTMIELNNRYALDGRDPNSWSGIMWVMGRFDRGWPERPVFGKVRSMSSDSTRRKVKLTDYLSRWGEQAKLL